MRAFWKDFVLSVLFGFVIPGVMLNGYVLLRDTLNAPVTEEIPGQTAVSRQIPVCLSGEDVTQIDLEEYLVGVVLGEMPADFEEEALKAQAVAARTYAWKAFQTGNKHVHGGLCTDPSCCQAYISRQAYLSRGGSSENIIRISSAVEDTAGLVLTYEGELIEATYFSCSGGMTESAVEVWGSDYPYLRSVASPGEEDAAGFTHMVSFPAAVFRDRLGITEPVAITFGQITRTRGGGVATMEICGTVFAGTELRRLLGLRSTAFTVYPGEDAVSVVTLGHGHRVGLSQYGANAMAAAGAGFEAILSWYYPGTQLTPIG